MKRFIIEREIPGASNLSEAELAGIAKTSNDGVDSLGVPYRGSTATSPATRSTASTRPRSEDAIREHARRGGFPANAVSVVANEFGPQTAERVGS